MVARVLIVDDHKDVRDGIRAALANEPNLRVVGEAVSGDDALGLALVLRPDLIVLDDEMPGSRGLDILPKLKVIIPTARIVMFTLSTGIAGEARLRGAEALIPKDDPTALVTALRGLAAAHVESRHPSEPARRIAFVPGGPWRDGGMQAVLVAGVALLYVIAFVPLAGTLGAQTTDLAVLVVATAAAVYGLRGGLVAAALAPVVNAFLAQEAGIAAAGAPTVTHMLIGLIIGAAVGRLRDVTRVSEGQTRSLADASVALEASDRRLVGLVEDAPVLLMSFDKDGVIVDALGAGFGDHPKFTAELMRGQQAAAFYPDNPPLLARLSRALAGDQVNERV